MIFPQAHAEGNLGTFDCISLPNTPFCPAAAEENMAAWSVNQAFTLILSFFTIIAGLAFLIYFVISALKWLTAGGDSQKVEAAQSGMTNGLIGLIIIVAAYGISWVVGKVFGLNILDPADSLINLFNYS